jgi:hypothetical protein
MEVHILQRRYAMISALANTSRTVKLLVLLLILAAFLGVMTLVGDPGGESALWGLYAPLKGARIIHM